MRKELRVWHCLLIAGLSCLFGLCSVWSFFIPDGSIRKFNLGVGITWIVAGVLLFYLIFRLFYYRAKYRPLDSKFLTGGEKIFLMRQIKDKRRKIIKYILYILCLTGFISLLSVALSGWMPPGWFVGGNIVLICGTLAALKLLWF